MAHRTTGGCLGEEKEKAVSKPALFCFPFSRPLMGGDISEGGRKQQSPWQEGKGERGATSYRRRKRAEGRRRAKYAAFRDSLERSLVVRTVRYSPVSGLSSLDAICQVQGDDGWRRVHQGS